MMFEIHEMDIKDKKNYYGYTAFEILKQTFIFYIHEYALYLAYHDVNGIERNTLDTIHLGLNVAQKFMSFWDHLAYSLSNTFGLDFTEREMTFYSVTEELLEEHAYLLPQVMRLKELYKSQSELRDRYRNPVTHRVHECFIRRNPDDTTEDKIMRITNLLEFGYKQIMKAFFEYREITIKYIPKSQLGSHLKKSVRKEKRNEKKKKKQKKHNA